jgi:hypothetical protein
LRHHYLQFALAVMLSARGFIGFHAAGLVKNGRAILLRGASGSGKSVLACAAVERGWQVLSDSTVWMDPQGGWWGFPWWLHLRRSAAALFPHLSLDSAPSMIGEEKKQKDEKVEVSTEQIRPGSALAHTSHAPGRPAGLVVFIERTADGRGSLESLPFEASRALWPFGGAGREMDARGYQDCVAAILRPGAFRLRLAEDLDQAFGLLEVLTVS